MIEFTGTNVTVMACSDCNTKCKHCYIGYSGNFSGEELFALCLNLMNRYKISLNGTELLLHPEYFKTMQMIRQNFIITNGLELARKPYLIKTLSEIGIQYVGISNHFFIHDDISSVNTDIVEPLLLLLAAEGIKADIRVTITTKNYDKIEEMCAIAYKMKASGIKFTNYIYPGKTSKLERDNILSDHQLSIFFKQLENARLKYNKENFLIRRCGSFGRCSNRKFYCPATINSVVITPDLKVYPCFFLARDGYEIGIVEGNKIFIYKQCIVNNANCMALESLNRFKHD